MIRSAPELDALLRELGEGLVFGQVWIQSEGPTFQLRHVCDRSQPLASLRSVAAGNLRTLAQFTASGQFRPLRSSPDLQSGWVHQAADAPSLSHAIQLIYPGALADWHAAKSAAPPLTSFVEFASRQTGIYRSVSTLTENLVEDVTRACCERRVCLKRRLWGAGALPEDDIASKSSIPCLEPCSIHLEMSRRATRLERETLSPVGLSGEEVSTLRAALQLSVAHPSASGRQGDLNDPLNLRRVTWCLNKFPSGPAGGTGNQTSG